MSPSARATTRSMRTAHADVVTKRRRASLDVKHSVKHSRTSTDEDEDSSIHNLSLAAPTKALASRVLLDDLPAELGVLIVNHLTIAAMANLTLCNKTTAGWVSKSLLAKVVKCEEDKDAGEKTPPNK